MNLVLSWNNLVSPSMVIESFAGYSSLGWQLCSLTVYIIYAQDILAFIVSDEKSGVILIGLPLYVIDLFPLLLLIFYLIFSAFVVLIIMCWEEFLFWSSLFGVL